jgi:hypothetical protein
MSGVLQASPKVLELSMADAYQVLAFSGQQFLTTVVRLNLDTNTIGVNVSVGLCTICI